MEVKEAKKVLQIDWTDNQAWTRLNQAQLLRETRFAKLEATKNSTAAKWSCVGNRWSKELFKFHRDKNKQANIHELIDGGRNLTT